MLYDLKFLEEGREWPPPSEKTRLERYDANRKLYEADHDAVYGQWWRLIRYNQQATLEIVVNFPRRLSNLWADLLVGEPPSYQAADARAMQNLVEDGGLNAAIREATIDASRFGDGLLKVRLAEGSPRVEAVSPELWFPVVSRGDVRSITHHVLAWTFENSADGLLSVFGASRRRYLVYEIHTKGRIEHGVKELSETGRLGPDLDGSKFFDGWLEDETHTADGPLVVHVPNQRTTNRLYGYDDYADIDGLVQEWEVRLGQISRVLDKHADPSMAGPPILADPNAPPGEKYFQVEGDESGMLPTYIVWDGNLDAAFRQIEHIMESLYLVSETSPSAFGHSQTGYAESGTSLRLRMQAPIAKAARLRTTIDPAVKTAAKLALALINKNAGDINITWKDGLPDDESERAEIEAMYVASGLTSKVSAIMRIFDLDEKAALEEIERMSSGPEWEPEGGGDAVAEAAAALVRRGESGQD